MVWRGAIIASVRFLIGSSGSMSKMTDEGWSDHLDFSNLGVTVQKYLAWDDNLVIYIK